jgi:tripartite-type tricarboxylate transporter receptor subunit TctC
MKRVWVCMVLSLCALAAGVTHGQEYPTKPVRIIVPFATGGGSDFIARAISVPLSKTLGQQFIIDNRPGAGSTLGSQIALKSPADGYTLLLIAGSYTTAPALYKNLAYDTLNDMTPVVQTENGPAVIVVHPSLPVKDVKQLVALAKSKPGQLNYASTGTGSVTHLATELFAMRTGIKITHIPYKGTGPGVIDTLAGNTQIMVGAVSAVIGHIQSGRLRGLAVTSSKRLPALPDMATVIEGGYNYQVNNWHGVVAPKGTPKAIIDKLNSEINKAIKNPEFAKGIAQDGLEPAGGTSEEFGALLKREVEEWAEVARVGNITIE